jgi:hypothetical protein
MKAIDVKHAEIGRVSSRKDGALTATFITPELTLDQRATMLGLHGINVRIMIEALDVPTTGLDEVTTELERKTQAQRLRAVIFVHWKDSKPTEDFETFYRKQMDWMIEKYKQKYLPSNE